jgi:uncharacterized protein (DUF2062 family)
MAGWREKTRDYIHSLLMEYRSPRQLSFAVALGTFVGASPLWGLHTVLALVLAFLLRLNKAAVVLGTLISNPWLAPLLLFGSLEIGSLIIYGTPTPLAFQEIREVFRDPEWKTILQDYVKPYFLGAFVLATLLAFLSYWITFWVSRSALREKPEQAS